MRLVSHRENLHGPTVEGFGEEWQAFDQSPVADEEIETLFGQYFAVFPWERLPRDAVGFDLGCGSGRWARLVAPRVGTLHCIDASDAALAVARRNLADQPNCEFHRRTVGELGMVPGSMDFGYSLGVLHHVPDTAAGIAACAELLKPGAPLLLYLYYALDNRPRWYRSLWRTSDLLRRVISRLPHPLKLAVSGMIALLVYLPLARTARFAAATGASFARHMPLAYYAERSLYTMRTDAYDRFGTRLEQRFTRMQIARMMQAAGLVDVTFSSAAPYWCAVGISPTAG
jgi:SAM-dependent methyltransferase